MQHSMWRWHFIHITREHFNTWLHLELYYLITNTATAPMPEKNALEKIRRQAALLKSDKALNLDFIVTVTSLYNDALTRLNKWKSVTKKGKR